MAVAVTTRSFSNYRDGANLAETVLNAIPVQKQGIKLLFAIALENDQRGTEGQPLIVSGLTTEDGEIHDVLILATMANDVCAFDADTGERLWTQHIANPIPGTAAMDMFRINDHWGILSTPVINPTTGTVYVCSMSSPDGLFADSSFHLHGLHLITGQEQFAPLDLNAASVTVTTADGKVKTSVLGSVARKQRCGLLFDSRNGVDTVFIANGSFLESADTNQGWIIACDVTGMAAGTAPTIAAAWTTTSRYSGGGLWMGGQGPSMDDSGFLYSMVGNGAFDGVTDFGESFVKVQYTPTTAAAPAKLAITDWFTPFTDTGRVGADPTLAAVSLIPGGQPGDRPGGPSNMDDPGDEDLNSGGPLYLPKRMTGFTRNIVLGAGKDGILYVIDADNMGKPTLAGMAPDRLQANVYDKLLMPPYGFTYYPAGLNCAPLVTSQIETTYGGFTHHQHSTPVFYKSPRFGNMLFTGGENGPVRAFAMTQNANGTIALAYLGCGNVIASADVPPPGGMPGTMMTLSANGTVEDTAVLWCLSPYGDANKTITPGRLVAYGADWIDNGQLVTIWDSQDWGIAYMHNKFDIPTCANGKLYVPTYDARVLVFGLA